MGPTCRHGESAEGVIQSVNLTTVYHTPTALEPLHPMGFFYSTGNSQNRIADRRHKQAQVLE